MERGVLNKMRNLFRGIWRDFRNPGLDHPAGSNCCGLDLPFDTSYLQPQPVQVKKVENHLKKFKQ